VILSILGPPFYKSAVTDLNSTLPQGIKLELIILADREKFRLIEQAIVSPASHFRLLYIQKDRVDHIVTLNWSPVGILISLPKDDEGHRALVVCFVLILETKMVVLLINLVLDVGRVLVRFIEQLFSHEVLAPTMWAQSFILASGLSTHPPLI
jgi:hypothetical protein